MSLVLKTSAFLATFLFAATLSAQAPLAADPETDRLVRDFVGACASPMTVKVSPVEKKLPVGVTGLRVMVESESAYCAGAYSLFRTPEGTYIGLAWPLGEGAGSLEEKIRTFAWDRLQSNFQAKIDRNRKVGGFYPVELVETTEFGKIPMRAMVDANGTFVLLGTIRGTKQTAREHLLGSIDSVVKKAPTKGAADAAISLIEFSDFQCPSCRAASAYVKPLLEKYGKQVRYTRVDLPLMSAHPWAFGAAVMGRAIHRQSPDAFWQFKDAIYENQDKLNNFTLEDFARGFVADHSLNVEKFDADVQSAAVKQEILDSIGAAYSVPILSTPTFIVNGQLVVGGSDGKALEQAIAALAK
jgi:protein-disulfide isomerase